MSLPKAVSNLTYSDIFYLTEHPKPGEEGFQYIGQHPTDTPGEVRVHSKIFAPGTARHGVVGHTFLRNDEEVFVTRSVPGAARPAQYRVTRSVSGADERNHSDEDIKKGTVLYQAIVPTYGCVDIVHGVAVTMDPQGGYPFFEFPRDALHRLP